MTPRLEMSELQWCLLDMVNTKGKSDSVCIWYLLTRRDVDPGCYMAAADEFQPNDATGVLEVDHAESRGGPNDASTDGET